MKLFTCWLRQRRRELTPEERALRWRKLRPLLRELAGLAGFGLLVAGISAFDWRVGLIAAGVILEALALAGLLLSARSGRSS